MINENMKLYDNLIYHLYQSDLCKSIQGYDYQQDNIVKLKTLCRLLSFFYIEVFTILSQHPTHPTYI